MLAFERRDLQITALVFGVVGLIFMLFGFRRGDWRTTNETVYQDVVGKDKDKDKGKDTKLDLNQVGIIKSFGIAGKCVTFEDIKVLGQDKDSFACCRAWYRRDFKEHHTKHWSTLTASEIISFFTIISAIATLILLFLAMFHLNNLKIRQTFRLVATILGCVTVALASATFGTFQSFASAVHKEDKKRFPGSKIGGGFIITIVGAVWIGLATIMVGCSMKDFNPANGPW